jgi:acyl carrier protein
VPIKTLTIDDLREILAEDAGLPEDDLPEDPKTPFKDLGLDSLAIVAVVCAVEQTCGIEVPDDDARDLTSISSVLAYVDGRVAAVQS